MSLGLFLGGVANSFNAGVKAAEDIADRRNVQDERAFMKTRRDRARREWADEDADIAERKRIYGGGTPADAKTSTPAPATSPEPYERPPAADHTARVSQSEEAPAAPAGTSSTEDAPAGNGVVVTPVRGYGLTPTQGAQEVDAFEAGLPKEKSSAAPAQAPGLGDALVSAPATQAKAPASPAAPAPSSPAPAAAPGQAPAAPAAKPRASSFLSEQDQQYVDSLRRRGRIDQANAFEANAAQADSTRFAARAQRGKEGHIGDMSDILQMPGGLNNTEALEKAKASALKHGQLESFMGYASKLDNILWSRSSQAVDDLSERAKGMSPLQIGQEARRIFNSDIGAGEVSEPIVGKDGRISFIATNRMTGQKTEMPARSPEELIATLRNFYKSPENLAAIKKQNDEMRLWRFKEDYQQAGRERLETIKGANRNGGVTVDEDGNLVMSGKGKPPATPYQRAATQIEKHFKSNDNPNAVSQAVRMAQTAFDLNPRATPEAVAVAAQEAVTNPESVQPRLDFGVGAPVFVHTNAADGTRTSLYRATEKDDLAKYAPAFKEDVNNFLRQEEAKNPNITPLLRKAATGDKDATTQLRGFLKGRIRDTLIKNGPDMTRASEADRLNNDKAADDRAEQLADKALASYGKALNLIRAYGQ